MLHHKETADVEDLRLLRPCVGNIGDGELRVRARRAHEAPIFVLDVHDQRATGAHIRRAANAGYVDERISERFKNIIAERVVTHATGEARRNLEFREIDRHVGSASSKRKLDAVGLNKFSLRWGVIDRSAPDVGKENTSG